MRFGIVVALLFAAFVVLCPVASAQSARPAISQAASELHDEQFAGGSVTVEDCHQGRQRGVVVCRATLTGTTPSPEGTVEATCNVAIAAVWTPVVIRGRSATTGGYWFPRLVSPMLCEGTLPAPMS